MKIVFIDLETTGLKCWEDRITELSAIMRINGRIVDELHLQGCSDKEYYTKFVSFLDRHVNKFDPDDKCFFAGWNSGFDMDFIRQLFKVHKNKFYGSYFWNPYYDIMQVALHSLRTRRSKLENFKLSTVASFLGIRVNQNALHSAKYDAILAKDVYNKVYN